ncbi:MAG: tryptophanase [Planctomycetaceae bacterium]|jgi:tryptophanase|nr:tryptophanase [Planctomycetaceae bacterium]
MANIKFFSGTTTPIEMHRVRIIQKLYLLPIDQRLECIKQAGNNTFLLRNADVFLDMLTDSGVNAMSNDQLAAMSQADDSYAGSATFYRLEKALQDVFGTKYFLPAHQGRACEHILSKVFVKPGQVVPMNYHFTTSKAHITVLGGEILEIPVKDAFEMTSTCPFKGNLDIDALKKVIAERGKDGIAYVRMEAGTNLIGGQPYSLANLREVSKVCRAHGIPLIQDISLLSDNLHFIKHREAACKNMSIHEIALAMAEASDIFYFSGRKLGFARGGGICMNSKEYYMTIRELVPLYEGFLTYGGMSVREMEALAVGMYETLDEDVISQGPQFIEFMTNELIKHKVPVVTPPGGLGCHLDACSFLPHVPQTQYTAGALASALFIISGVRGMERGTLSEQRNEDGTEPLASMELVRLALPRRVFTMSQIVYTVDRINWLYQNRNLVGGLKWIDEPKILRFFYGLLEPVGDWQQKLVAKFKADFGDSL